MTLYRPFKFQKKTTTSLTRAPSWNQKKCVVSKKCSNKIKMCSHGHIPTSPKSTLQSPPTGLIFCYPRPICQKVWRFHPDRQKVIQDEVNKLLATGFIREVEYPNCWQTWWWSLKKGENGKSTSITPISTMHALKTTFLYPE